MRLNVPPILKQSALSDSHSICVNSPININSRSKIQINEGFKRSPKHFKEDEHSELCEQMAINEMMATQSRKQNSTLLPPQYGSNITKKPSYEFEDDLKIFEASFLKKMPLFNQFQQESNMSEIKISEIPKKQFEYQEDFNEEELPTPIKNSLKRKSSSGELQSSIDRSPEVLWSGLKKLRSIDTINEESSSSIGTSLNGSRTVEPKLNMMSSLRKIKDKEPQQYQTLKPIQEYNKKKNGMGESSSSYSKANKSAVRMTKDIQQVKNNRLVETSEVESQREVSPSYVSQKSSSTVYLNDNVEESKYLYNRNKKNTNMISQKMAQIQKSMLQNDESNIMDRTQVDPPMASIHKDIQMSQNSKLLLDSDQKIFTNINQRFQKIKEIKYGKNENPSSNNQTQLTSSKEISEKKKVTFSTDKSQQKSTQTEAFSHEASFSESNLKQVHKKYKDQISQLQRENQRLQKEINMANESINSFETIKKKQDVDNKFLLEKIKKLQRILEKNEKQLSEWKLLAKQGRIEPSKMTKQNKEIKQINMEWKHKEENFLCKIAQLQKQLENANFSLKSMTQRSLNFEEYQKPFKNDKKYKQHIEKLHQYEQALKRNMEIIRLEQQKIINEWRLIDQYHMSLNFRQNRNSHYQGIQREQTIKNYVPTVPFRSDEEQNFKDKDVAQISAKVKLMRNYLARDTR